MEENGTATAGWKRGARLHDCTAGLGWVKMLRWWDNEWVISIKLLTDLLIVIYLNVNNNQQVP